MNYSNMFFFFFTFMCKIIFFFFFLNKIFILKFNFILFNFIKFSFILFFDKFNFLFLFILMMIFLMIFLYGKFYMNKDQVFLYMILSFTFIMVMLIFNLNLFSLLMWWDLLGLISFLLVLFYSSGKILNYSFIVMIFNRLSDMFFLMAVIFLLSDVNLNLVFNFIDLFDLNLFFLMLSFMIKSSQFPFNLWLPIAMVAPMPVSALVHSSTLVVVGLYFLFRFNLFISKDLLLFLTLITMFFFGIGMIFSNDLKKIMALSTMNHMSMMMILIYLDLCMYMYIYMLIHALMKSMMFMCIGVMIFNSFDIQDIRKLSDL